MYELLIILSFFMIIGALIAVETTNLLSSIICVGAVGFLLAIAFLLMGAPDIAITQVVVDILCLIILIRATISRDLTAISGDREFLGMIVTVVFVLGIGLCAIRMLADFPAFGDAVMTRFADTPSGVYLREGLARTGAANAVTGVLLDFRAYDTLGEATVLFCAVMGALAILRKKARKAIEDPDDEGGLE